VGDHLADGESLAAVARPILGLEPVEAGPQVVGPLLLHEDQREAMAFCERRPARTRVIARRRLRASVQDENEGRDGASRSGTKANIRKLPGLLPNRTTSVRIGRRSRSVGGARVVSSDNRFKPSIARPRTRMTLLVVPI